MLSRSQLRCRAITLAAALIGSAGAAADPAPPAATTVNGWDIQTTTVPLTGATAVAAVLQSSAPLYNMIGAPETASLVLRCSERVLAAYVAWPQVLRIDSTGFMDVGTQTMVLWRADDAPIAVNFWDRSDDGSSAGKFTTGGAAKVIGRIVGAKRLVVRMTGTTTQDAVFDLGDVASVAAKVEGACGVGLGKAS